MNLQRRVLKLAFCLLAVIGFVVVMKSGQKSPEAIQAVPALPHVAPPQTQLEPRFFDPNAKSAPIAADSPLKPIPKPSAERRRTFNPQIVRVYVSEADRIRDSIVEARASGAFRRADASWAQYVRSNRALLDTLQRQIEAIEPMEVRVPLGTMCGELSMALMCIDDRDDFEKLLKASNEMRKKVLDQIGSDEQNRSQDAVK